MKMWSAILGMLALGACLVLRAQDAPKPTAGRPAQAPAAPKGAERPDDERAIQALVEAFTKAFNAGDAAAVAATYTDGAVVVDEDGQRTVGRAAIQDQYAASFAEAPGSKIAIQAEALHFLGTDTALEEGRATLTPVPGGGAPEASRYTAIYVKQGGHWLQAAVRDMADEQALAPRDHLKELEWLTGEWVNESEEAVVLTTCKLADNGNFLVREFTMKARGLPVMTGTQRIGWDPVRKQFKSWMFDSEGGFLEGYWTHRGNQWLVRSEGATSAGQATTMTNIITRLGKDRVSWQSVDRTVGGAAVPGVDEFTLVRKPPEVGK